MNNYAHLRDGILKYPLIELIDDDLLLLANTPKGGMLSNNDRNRLTKKYQDDNNDALEFLGDTVLELIVADLLFDKKLTAGNMTKISSNIVRNVSLICLMNDKKLCNLNTVVTKSCADLFEAYLGAIYTHLKQYDNINIVGIMKQWLLDEWNIDYYINYIINHPGDENICKAVEQQYEDIWILEPPDLSHIQSSYEKLQKYYNYFQLGQIQSTIGKQNNQWSVKIKCPLTIGCQFYVDKVNDIKYIGVGYNRDKTVAIENASKQAIDLLLNDYNLT